MMNNENIILQKADLDQIELVADLFDKYRVFYKQSSNVEEGKKFIRERMENQQSVIFLAIEKQENLVRPLGFVQLYPSYSSVNLAKIWILNDLYVEQSARRRGVATRLMQKAKEFALETGAKELTLETAKDNHQAQQLYELIGYKKDSEHFYYNLL
ncbi:GNAT family N-acetyltransferase [Virgibacillus sp. YIM 98842]|uniref:GNAT family N-acetyltransferase n=1 Tax=Virgibacillus sp. YIM 98842 TaxID=2663533 RepID=UPI0013DB0A2B|nr:GNAT family N-acetyltransferase [Virgibacillus sp. YIM 98842]